MGIPFLAQHSHEAFRRTSKSLTEIHKANCPIDVLAQDHLCRIQIPGQHIVDGFEEKGATIILSRSSSITDSLKLRVSGISYFSFLFSRLRLLYSDHSTWLIEYRSPVAVWYRPQAGSRADPHVPK